VGTLRAAGLHPYLVDFGNPDAAQSTVRLDDYVLDWIPAVVEAMRRDCGHSEFAILGYCMGGLFAFMTAAVQPQWGQDLRGIVSIGAPIDSAKMGMLSFLSRTAHGQLDLLASKIGNIPGQLSSAAFKMMMPWRTVTQKADLFLNLWDDEWVRGHESLEAWVGGFLDYPADAFRQFFHDFMKDNQLVAGTMRFGEHTADLRNVRCPVLAFGGTDDKVVPVAAARAALGALGSPDVRFREVPGGHMGVVAGLRAKNTVWAPSRDFLLEIAART
jgi:polyhydroxyalkanoate synthase